MHTSTKFNRMNKNLITLVQIAVKKCHIHEVQIYPMHNTCLDEFDVLRVLLRRGVRHVMRILAASIPTVPTDDPAGCQTFEQNKEPTLQ